MFRRLDKFVGRHMSSWRWVAFWIVFALGDIALMVVCVAVWSPWWFMLFIPYGLGLWMIGLNAARGRL